MELAEKMLIAARREVLEKSKERFDQTQIEEKFEPGEHVRYFNRLIVRRDDAAEVSTKLKLRNTRYVVVRRLSYSRYLIKHLYTGREKDAHVTQIARMRLDEATAPELPEAAVEPVVEVDALWKKVKPGKFVVFWVRTNSKAHLTLMEVVNVNDNDQELFGWYYCHRVPCARYLYERPLVQMRFAPEWIDDRGQSWIGPSEARKEKLKRLMENYNSQEVELICAGFDMESNGKTPGRVIETVDAWLRKAAKDEPEALKALSHPTAAEENRAKKL